jgi:hypothetical protein
MRVSSLSFGNFSRTYKYGLGYDGATIFSRDSLVERLPDDRKIRIRLVAVTIEPFVSRGRMEKSLARDRKHPFPDRMGRNES